MRRGRPRGVFPTPRSADRCQKVSATIQGAIDGAVAGDTIRVGPDNPAERIGIGKRVRITGVPGHLITDAGLPASSDPLIRFAGAFQMPVLERLVLDVVTSAAGIIVPTTVRNIKFKGLQITSSALPRPAYGLQVNGNERTYFEGAGSLLARVAGFEVGIEFNNVTWLDIEAGVVIEDNGVGLRVVHGKGQIFWNMFRNNGVGLETRGVFHLDTNNNDFLDNEVGLRWGLAAGPTRPPDGSRAPRRNSITTTSSATAWPSRSKSSRASSRPR